MVVGICHRIVVLNQGRNLAEGRPADVMGLDRVQEAYFGG
jgi:branched-chain amino acid transport system ATP-binding protein